MVIMMKVDKLTIEKRLENMKNFYIKTEELLDNLPHAIPDKTKDFLKEKSLEKKNLSN